MSHKKTSSHEHFVSIRFPVKLLRKLDAKAKQENTTRSEFVRDLVRKAFNL